MGAVGLIIKMDSVNDYPAIPTDVVDTTGAGDTFTGYILAGLDRGMPMEQAIRLASHAASIMVSRQGTADVIPDLKDIQDRFGGILIPQMHRR